MILLNPTQALENKEVLCFCSSIMQTITLIFSEARFKKYKYDQRTQDLLYARVNKQVSLCHYMHTICHPLLSDLCARETLSTCATSLAGISRDHPHVLNASPVNRLERYIVCK